MLPGIVLAARFVIAVPNAHGRRGLCIFVRQVDLARPDAPMIIPEFRHGSNPIDRLAQLTLEEESHGVEQVSDLLHEMEAG